MGAFTVWVIAAISTAIILTAAYFWVRANKRSWLATTESIAILIGVGLFVAGLIMAYPTEVVYQGIIKKDSSPISTLTPTPTASTSAPLTAQPTEGGSSVPPAPSSPATSGSDGALLINVSIDETYAAGKDKAWACPEPGLFCLILNLRVDNKGEEVSSDCPIFTRLYNDKTGKLLARHTDTDCRESFVGDHVPMPPGRYRVEIKIELADGTTGSAIYRFVAVPR